MAGIYIHIPFCKKACHYCNFHFSTTLNQVDDIVKCIVIEAEQRKEYLKETVDTIYFGGGTPSILQPESIAVLLNSLQKNYSINPNAEITLEANPDDITKENLLAWQQIGINRLSLGIQSFVEAELVWMNRSHTAKQAKQSIHLIKEYFNNYSIDLIFGSQLLTHEQWLQNIQTALSFQPPHLSCYALTVEEKTALGNKVAKNILPNIDNTKQAEQFEILMDALQHNGYIHYEISNYALPGFESKHNSSYWQGKHYVGLGPSAHSFNGMSRSWNISNNAAYIEGMQNGNIILEAELLTKTQQLNEYIMIGLRINKGVEKGFIELNWGRDILSEFLTNASPWLQSQHLMENSHSVVLTQKGKLFADAIASDLFF